MNYIIICLIFLAGMTTTALADTLNVSLRNKTFNPVEATVKDGDTITICNNDTVFHQLFSYSKHNRFEARVLRRGDCTTLVARNPTSQRIKFDIFDDIHANEKLWLTVLPNGSGESDNLVGTKWRIAQSGGHTGTLEFQHQSGNKVVGAAYWDSHSRGYVSGTVDGNAIQFTIKYNDGLIGTYEATIGNGRMYNGTARSNKGGGVVSWSASRQ